MQDINVLSEEKVFKNGTEFDGDVVCWSGIYGCQVYIKPMEEGGEPFTGLLYEKLKNGHMAYYAYYRNGIKHGECVSFYESTKIKEYYVMRNAQIFGEDIQWYENGSVKSIGHYKYSIKISYEEWDENGNLINRITEPSDFGKGMIEKNDSTGFNNEKDW